MRVEILAHTPDLERLISASAKLCYSKTGLDGLMDTTDEQVDKFLNKLVDMGHQSPIEHASFTFAVEGVSRVFSHQLVRHRIASYSQQSQRYVKLDQFEYVIPPAIEMDCNLKDEYAETMKYLQDKYEDLRICLLSNQILEYTYSEGGTFKEKYEQIMEETGDYYVVEEEFKNDCKKLHSQFEKKAIEDARFVFPNACETKVIFTMNARTLLHFFSERCCSRAQWEIRDVANEMLRQCREIAPTLFKKAGASCTYGKCKEGKMTCGNPIKLELKGDK